MLNILHNYLDLLENENITKVKILVNEVETLNNATICRFARSTRNKSSYRRHTDVEIMTE